MEYYIILHNPRCSKSRETLGLLESHGIRPEIIEYLSGRLTKEFLKDVIASLRVSPRDLLRNKEKEFYLLEIDLDDSEKVIEAILNHPILLERPIVIKGKKAVIGRPPENVLLLIND